MRGLKLLLPLQGFIWGGGGGGGGGGGKGGGAIYKLRMDMHYFKSDTG